MDLKEIHLVGFKSFADYQKIDFDETGYPIMGLPAGCDTLQNPPSGEIE